MCYNLRKTGFNPEGPHQLFLDYKQNSPNARLVLEYMYGPMDSIIENIALVESYL